MITIMRGEVYLDEEHIQLINSEEEYVKQRYFAVARAEPIRITRKEAAEVLGLSVRQIKRIVKKFKEEGIDGLKKKSTRPNSSPNKVPEDVERIIVEVRNETGFGPERIAIIVNKALKVEGRKPVSDTTCYNVLARNGLVEAEKRIQTEYMYFEMNNPDELVQADITYFNGVPIMTMEDDYSRMEWATSMINSTEERVTHAMKTLYPDKYESLITDNGSQFSRKNSNITVRKAYLACTYGLPFIARRQWANCPICRRD